MLKKKLYEGFETDSSIRRYIGLQLPNNELSFLFAGSSKQRPCPCIWASVGPGLIKRSLSGLCDDKSMQIATQRVSWSRLPPLSPLSASIKLDQPKVYAKLPLEEISEFSQLHTSCGV